jgi:ABC-2 type transport system permease protein
MLPGTALVREKERGTAEQLLVSPLTPLAILLSKIAAMTLVSVLGMIVAIFGVLTPLVGLSCRGSMVLFLGMTAAYACATAGLGIFLATLTRTSAQLGLLTLLVVLPLVQLSGLWNTVETMPVALRLLIELSPLRHFGFVVYGILLKGSGLAELWPHALAIVSFGATVFVLAARRFQAQFAAGVGGA